ncbi:MAG: hypothetical protein JKY89_05870 [Immundisolibacteraceae bacterium]|nr:hypothetical protein [Immundisolibacteraceae bacterium]
MSFALKRPWLAVILTAFFWSLLVTRLANAQISGEFETLAGPGWEAHRISLEFELTPTPEVSLSIGQLRFSSFDLPLNNLRFRCRQLGSGPGRLWCRSLQASAEFGSLSSIEVIKLALAFEFDWAQSELLTWSVVIEDASFSTGLLEKYLPPASLPSLLSEFTMTDSLLVLQITAAGRGSQLENISGSLGLDKFGFSSPWGTQAAEGLSGDIDFSIALDREQDRGGAHYQFSTQMVLSAGDVFINPLFLTLGTAQAAETASIIEFKAAGRWQADDLLLSLNVSYQHEDLLEIAGAVELDLFETTPKLLSGFGRLRVPQLAETYPVYIQPFVGDTLLDDLSGSGKITTRVSYHLQGGITSLGLRLEEITLIDRQQRFSISGMTANLPYMGPNQSSEGTLAWDHIQLYRLPFGAGSSSINFYQFDPADSIKSIESSELMEPPGSRLELEVSPVAFLDGLLRAGQVSISGLGRDSLQVTLGGRIEPVSLAKLSVALGWPEMAGSLSGVLPAAHYQHGRITLDGKLALNIFDGEIEVADLEIENLFGLVPRVSASLRADQLDLGLLTNTFEFGAISGRLSGHINQLKMESWQPVAFDGWFQTPEGDPGPHKISQKALNSLSSVGGLSGALQSTLLRFFDDFSYRRLGIGCKLDKGVCQMRGIADHGDGYSIVEGGGFWPQINLVGYNREVDWQVLLRRISAAANAEQLEFR